jgi:hypothetical protein
MSTFKDAPGLVESRALAKPASEKFQRRGCQYAIPVNTENIERMIAQWKLDGSLRTSPTPAEVQQILQGLHNTSAWLKTSWPRDIEWSWLSSKVSNHYTSSTMLNQPWYSRRATPSLIALIIVGLLFIAVRHKKRQLEGIARAKPAESIKSH